MKIAFLTLGCRTNQAESFQIENAVQSAGHEIVGLSDNPDICIINTCTVTAKADYQSRQLINRALRAHAKVIVTGCYSELNFDTIKNTHTNVELFRNSDKAGIIQHIGDADASDASSSKGLSRHRPIVKVQDGCDYACTYCTIPKARGKSRSIQQDAVVREVEFYESLGCSEVVLTGIHLGTYGLDLPGKQSLSGLLATVLRSTGLPRIRLSSLEMNEIDDKLIELLVDPRVCSHLHVPLQSGDDRILKLMNRTYTVKEYVAGFEGILKKIPGIAFGTDVIAGFPGEGDPEFSNTHALLQALPFSYLHVFPYSPRPGTRAVDFPGHVPERVKKDRVSRLRALGAAKRSTYIEGNIGKTLAAVVEERHAHGYTGTTGNYIKAFIKTTDDIRAGKLVPIRIMGQAAHLVAGVPVKSSEPLNN